MKLFIKLLLLILVIGLAAPFILKRPDGQPWMALPEKGDELHNVGTVTTGMFSQMKQRLTGWANRENDREPHAKTKVYRWQDSVGGWHLSDTPPTDSEAEVIWVDPDTNLIQGSRPQAADVAEETPPPAAVNNLPLPLSLPPDQIEELQRQTEMVRQKLEQRNKEIP